MLTISNEILVGLLPFTTGLKAKWDLSAIE